MLSTLSSPRTLCDLLAAVRGVLAEDLALDPPMLNGHLQYLFIGRENQSGKSTNKFQRTNKSTCVEPYDTYVLYTRVYALVELCDENWYAQA